MEALTKPARVVSQSLLRLQSDTRLAQLARDGHEPAFDTLVERYRAELVRASDRIVGPDRSEDAVQQALLNAHRAIDTTENVQNLRAWLHKIGHNSSLNMLRSLRDEVPLGEQHNLASSTSGPAEAAELSERLSETLAAIDKLPERQRAALLLRELEGRSHEDIAATLGLSPGAARQQLMRARQGVRRAVTAFTPYPLIAALASPGSHAGVTELAFGAGASATAAKLCASVAATGAIAGGVFGASVAVENHTTEASKATTTTTTTVQTVSQTTPAAAALASTTDDRGGMRNNDQKTDNSGKDNGKGKDADKTDNRGKARGNRQSSDAEGGRRGQSQGRAGNNSKSGQSSSTGSGGPSNSGSGDAASGLGSYRAGSDGGSGNSRHSWDD